MVAEYEIKDIEHVRLTHIDDAGPVKQSNYLAAMVLEIKRSRKDKERSSLLYLSLQYSTRISKTC